MPGLMVHILVAQKLKPNASLDFFLGCLSPDGVSDWKTKDITHFRNFHDRSYSLLNFARNNEENDFNLGMLLHLYTDWKWDVTVRDTFIENIGESWFVPYRKELGKCGSYLFHNCEICKDIFTSIYNIDISNYKDIDKANAQEIYDMVNRNYLWHIENDTGISSVFTPEIVETFVNTVSDEFLNFIKQHNLYKRGLSNGKFK